MGGSGGVISQLKIEGEGGVCVWGGGGNRPAREGWGVSPVRRGTDRS